MTLRGSQWLALARLWAVTAGRAVIRRAQLPYLGLAILSALIFGGSGMHPATLTGLALAERWLHLVLAGGWLLLTMPAVEAVFATPSSFFLRGQPIGRWGSTSLCLLTLLLLQLPWTLLWLSGQGLLWAAGSTVWVAAAGALAAARVRDWLDAALAAALAAALCAAQPELLLLSGAVVVSVAARRAWLRAPERYLRRRRSLVRGPSLLALCLALLVSLPRGHGRTTLLSGFLWLAGATVGYLMVRNNELSSLAEAGGGVHTMAATTAVLSVAVLAPVVERIARQGEEILISGGAPRWLRQAGTILTPAVIGGVLSLALTATIIILAVSSASLGELLAALAAAGLAGGGWGGVLGVIASGSYQQSSARRLLALLVVVAASIVLPSTTTGVLPAAGIVSLLSAAVGLRCIRHAGAGHPAMGSPRRNGLMLEVRDIWKHLGGREVLTGVDLDCRAGEMVVVTGRNGAGKSTLLRIVAGLLQPDRGTVVVCDKPLAGEGAEARRCLGYVPDTLDGFPDLRISELWSLLRALRGAAEPDDGDRFEIRRIWHQPLKTLSLGQKKRAGIAAALLGSPPLLVLDEPSNGLDPAGVRELLELFSERAEQGRATLVATNDASFSAALDGRRLVLQTGQLEPA